MFIYILAFCKGDVPRLTEAAVLYKGLAAGIIKAVCAVNIYQEGV